MLKRSKKNAEGKVTLQGHRFYKFYPHSALNALYQNEESVFIDTCCSKRVTTNFLRKLGS